LGKQNGKAYSLQEAKEIGDGLIDFYSLLMEFEKEARADNKARNIAEYF
jgi:hypothetical protein